VVLEAMSHALPVIVVDHGGPATTVTADCGVKIAPASVEGVVAGIADAIASLAASPDMRARMGAAGRKRVADEYLWEVKGRKVMGIYEAAISRWQEEGRR
jgi:glycosyltransferase involved in cell wall biosynthesis